MLRKIVVTAAFVACAIPAFCSLLWILLFAYIGAVMLYQGNGDGFIELFTRENLNAMSAVVAVTVLVASTLAFMRWRRRRTSR